MSVIDWAASNDPTVLRRLRAHPSVVLSEAGDEPLAFRQGETLRHVAIGDLDDPLYGLVELSDNNPLVCADRISIPSPTAALALVALGPVVLAGVAAQPPLIHFNVPSANAEITSALQKLGPLPQVKILSSAEIPSLKQDVESGLFGKEQSAEGLVCLQASVSVSYNLSTSDVHGLFDERFGRSFFVRRQPLGYRFRTADLLGKPFAHYTVEVLPGASFNTVLIEAAADPAGKLGAAGLVHAMNVMAGLEESLGLNG